VDTIFNFRIRQGTYAGRDSPFSLGSPNNGGCARKKYHRYPRILLFVIVAFLLGESLPQGVSSGTAYGAPQVLINRWDGTEWTILEDMWDKGQVPNLHSVGPLHHLTDNRECFRGLFPVCPCEATTTKPQHTIMLTGKLHSAADAKGWSPGQ